MATDFGFVPSGEGVGPGFGGFGEVSFSTEPENSSFETSGDWGFGTQNDAWFQGSGEDPGFETEKKKKKKKNKKEKDEHREKDEKDESHGSLDAVHGSDAVDAVLQSEGSGLDPRYFPVSSARRVSFSEDPPESRTFGNFDFADKVASAAMSPSSSPTWEHFSRDEVFEASQAQANAKTPRFSEQCSQCGRAFELTDSRKTIRLVFSVL